MDLFHDPNKLDTENIQIQNSSMAKGLALLQVSRKFCTVHCRLASWCYLGGEVWTDKERLDFSKLNLK